MRISELLQEVTIRRRVVDWLTKPLYHVTSLESAALILKSNKMRGSMSAFEPSGTFNKNASPFYVSMATSRNAQYGLSMMREMKPVVMFEFKGMKEFEQSTLNYWEQEDSVYGQNQGKVFYKFHNEDEKRIYLETRNIENIKKYIKRVDVAFYGDANYPSDSRKLLRTINAAYPNARYHKTMSGLLSADRGVSFDEVMELVSGATEQTSIVDRETSTAGDLDSLAAMIAAKKANKKFRITDKVAWDIISRTGKSNIPRVVQLFTELNKMFVKAKTIDKDATLVAWIKGKI